MSASTVIRELKELPSREREKVLRWLQQQGLKGRRTDRDKTCNRQPACSAKAQDDPAAWQGKVAKIFSGTSGAVRHSAFLLEYGSVDYRPIQRSKL